MTTLKDIWQDRLEDIVEAQLQYDERLLKKLKMLISHKIKEATTDHISIDLFTKDERIIPQLKDWLLLEGLQISSTKRDQNHYTWLTIQCQ